jgi:hypothetical protein
MYVCVYRVQDSRIVDIRNLGSISGNCRLDVTDVRVDRHQSLLVIVGFGGINKSSNIHWLQMALRTGSMKDEERNRRWISNHSTDWVNQSAYSKNKRERIP